MANIFEVALVNPFRFVPKDESDIFLINQDNKCYFQKWQLSDATKLQIISDFSDIVCELRDFYSNALVSDMVVTEVPTTIIDQTYLAYEIEFNWISFPPGKYYIYLAYTDELDVLHEFYSEPQCVQDVQPDTLLFEYTNSENNFGVIFNIPDSINFQFRVEGTIKEFTPVSDDIIYTDQLKNATLLNSVPYRSFTLFIGNPAGLPDWVTDKVNRIMSCDEKQINGDYYEKIEGEKWEVSRADLYAFSGMTIKIMPVENVFLQRLKTGEQPPEGFIIVEHVKNFFANAANLAVAGIFTKYTLLKHISIINYGGAFTMNVGTTDGGSEIGTFEVPSAGSTFNIKWLFLSPSTLYITGLGGTNADILLDYLQYDEVPATPAPSPSPEVGVGAVVLYDMPPSQLAIDFDLGSGLGNVGTLWAGWAIMDGRNGTRDLGGLYPIGYKAGDPDFGVIGDTVGNPDGEVELSISNLPENEVTFTFGLDKRGSIGSDGLWSNFGEDGSKTIEVGGLGEPFSILPESVVLLWVKKIA